MKVLDRIEAWRMRRALRAATAIGPGARLVGRPWIENRGRLTFGRDVSLTSIPVQSHIVAGPNGLVLVGDRVTIAHGVAICGHSEVTIGDGTTVGPFAIILDIDFHEVDDRTSIGTARPIRIGRNVRIGAGAVVLRGATVGDDAVIEPNAVVSRRIPNGMRVAGVPARPVGAKAA